MLWSDRLEGSKTNLRALQQILLCRGLFLEKSEQALIWIEFCRTALKDNQLELCKKTLKVLSEEVKDPKRQFDIDTLLVECKFFSGELKDE